MKKRFICFVCLTMVFFSEKPFLFAQDSSPLPLNPGSDASQIEASQIEASQEESAEIVSVSDLIAQAYEKNPMIQAAREDWRGIIGNYRMVTSYPDPQFMVTYFPQPIETRLGPQDWNASLTQMIPFPGKLSKAGEIVQADARIARLNLDKTIRDVTVSVLESFHELRYIRKAKEIAVQNRQLLDHLRKVSETAHAQEKAGFADVIKAQSQIAQLHYDALLLDELEQTEIARLNGLLNRDPDTRIRALEEIIFPPFPYQLKELYQMAETDQEEIRAADIQVEKADAQTDLAQYQNLPEFRVGIFYAGIGNPEVAMPPDDAGQDAIGIQFGVSIPLWFGKNTGRMERARADTEKAKAAKNSRIIETRTRIRTLFFRLQNSQRLILLYREEMLPQALKAVETAEIWFREGEGSFSDFIETQSALYNFQLSLARADADYGKYLARLEQLIGVKNERGPSGAESLSIQ